MRVGGYPLDEIINDQEVDLEISGQIIDPRPLAYDAQEYIQDDRCREIEVNCLNADDEPGPVLDDRL